MADITVVTATALETRIARRTLHGVAEVVQAGVGLSRIPAATFATPVVSCGLAGATRGGVPTGTLLIPCELVTEDGRRRACDDELVAALLRGARRCGIEPVTAALASSRVLVRGRERQRYAALGCAGVDMESAFIDAPAIAAVRVILDGPGHELSDAWLSPARAVFSPGAWGELPWLAVNGPRCARLAARVIAAALGDAGSDGRVREG